MNRLKFLTENLQEAKNAQQIERFILSYLSRKTGTHFDMRPETEILSDGTSGKVFMFGDNSAIRIRWPSGNFAGVNRLDYWTEMNIDDNGDWNAPQFTLKLPPGGLMAFLPQIATWLKSPKTGTIPFDLDAKGAPEPVEGQGESQQVQMGNTNLTEAIVINGVRYKNRRDLVDQMLKKGKTIDEIVALSGEKRKDIEWHVQKARMEAGKGEQIKTERSPEDQHNQAEAEAAEEGEFSDPNIIFDDMEFQLELILQDQSFGLIVAGDPGVGKTFNITKFLKAKLEDYDKEVYVSKGTMTSKSLYATLFFHNGEILILDDTDSVWKDAEAANILKAALDDKKERLVSWNSEKCFKVERGDEGDMEKLKAIQEETGQYPNRFYFTGKIIFISNLYKDKFDSAVMSRVGFIELNLRPKDIFQLIERLIKQNKLEFSNAPMIDQKMQLFVLHEIYEKVFTGRGGDKKPSIRKFTKGVITYAFSDEQHRMRRTQMFLR